MKIYCISDIHGNLFELEEALYLILENLGQIDTQLILLGDYIHGGYENYEVLDRIMELQDFYGEDKVIALRGNHEDLVLSGYSSINDDGREIENVDLDQKYIDWIKKLPVYYTCGNTIFCHAGIDEEAGEDWQWGTSDEIFTGKYPASIGKIDGLDKKVVAGHVPTSEITGNDKYHDIYYDGESHFYIDGGVLHGGIVPVLLVNTEKEKYYRVLETGNEEIKPYNNRIKYS